MESAFLFLLGGFGAACYAFPAYMQQRWAKEPPYATWLFAFAIIVGALFGGVFTPFIGNRAPWAVSPEPYPLAFVLGLMANPILPLIINKGKALFEGWSPNGGKSS